MQRGELRDLCPRLVRFGKHFMIEDLDYIFSKNRILVKT